MGNIILTGERPTGPLHIGHYVGSLKNRVKIQNEGNETVKLKAGEAIAQGIFIKYLTTESDNNLGIERKSDY